MQVNAIYLHLSYLPYEEVTLFLIIDVNEGVAETPLIVTWCACAPFTGVGPAQGYRGVALQHRMEVVVRCAVTFGPCIWEVAYLDTVVVLVMSSASIRFLVVISVYIVHRAG